MSEYDVDTADPADKAAALQRRDDWEGVLATPGGRRVMWELLRDFGLLQHVAGDVAIGRRTAALDIMNRCRAFGNGDYWRTMFQENDR